MNKDARIGCALAAFALVVSCLSIPERAAAQMDPGTAAALESALSAGHRSDRNKARDRYRHPMETLAFFGMRRDMTVVEIWPGAGWYAEVLAPALKGTGKLIEAEYGRNAPFDYQRQEMATLKEKAGRFPDVFGEVHFTEFWGPVDLEIAPQGTVDLVLTFRNVHNWVWPQYKQDPARLFGAILRALKPGGVLGIVDHRWPDPATEDQQATNGYISEERVISMATAAGFEFAGRSEVNRNPKDTHDYRNGVWTLPPELNVASGEDRRKYIEIGESDRFTLKFRKPSAR